MDTNCPPRRNYNSPKVIYARPRRQEEKKQKKQEEAGRRDVGNEVHACDGADDGADDEVDDDVDDDVPTTI